MRRALLVGLLALAASAGVARADTWVVLKTPVLPSASESNASVALPADLSAGPAYPQQLTGNQLQSIWQAASTAYGVPWAILAAINKIETNFGENMGPSSAGAIGWMQFMPGTWRGYGTDANGDGVADPWNAEDAIYSAARYLAANGAATDLRKAIFAYNHADWYVEDVLNLAATYDAGGVGLALTIAPAAAAPIDTSAEEQRIADAKDALARARARARELVRVQRELEGSAQVEELVTERLDSEREAAAIGAQLAGEREEIASLREELRAAEEALVAAQTGARAGALGVGAGYIGSAPSLSNGWVFPVGGGSQLVSVGRDHHDYAAADIVAPAGSPVYALAEAAVVQSWPEPEGRCGIGATIQTVDGQNWTYCHLAYLDPSVSPGTQLQAGTFMGLVGETGHATGPHLHLQLQPATSYPQAQQWFESFAGTAFRWQDSVASNGVPTFAVVDDAVGLNSAPAFAER